LHENFDSCADRGHMMSVTDRHLNHSFQPSFQPVLPTGWKVTKQDLTELHLAGSHAGVKSMNISAGSGVLIYGDPAP
jgi:hypothetical protein